MTPLATSKLSLILIAAKEIELFLPRNVITSRSEEGHTGLQSDATYAVSFCLSC